MATLICAAREPDAHGMAGLEALCAAGEAVVLVCPGAVTARSPAELESRLEDGRLAILNGPPLPPWLDAGDYERVLLVSAASSREELDAVEREMVARMLRSGCESVDLTPPDSLPEIMQSWYSGRRVGTPLR